MDEYQDLNFAQYVLLQYLAQPHRNVCVVGDLVQGIYSWRGADIRYLAQFRQDYPQAREVALEQNYRSTGAILKLVNALSASLEYGRRRLWTKNPQGELASIHVAEDEHGEARLVVREIQRFMEQGHLPSDCAVLYRTRSQARRRPPLPHLGEPPALPGPLRRSPTSWPIWRWPTIPGPATP